MKQYRGLLGPIVVVALFLIGTRWSPFEPHQEPSADAPRPPAAPITGSARAQTGWSDDDWALFTGTIDWAEKAGVDSLPLGEAMATVGRRLVGTPYVPGTLEVDGPERTVVNFQGLDCVTFVENVFALTRFVRMGGRDLIGGLDRTRPQRMYEALLAEIRYRNGQVGYPTRLHYFSDWIAHNTERGLLVDLTESLGGVPDSEPIDFMTTHTSAYPQLSDPALVRAIAAREDFLTAEGRHYVPEDRIAEVADGIQNGDVIAATSTVEGLDVAHTGLALWVDGALHLLHAPLVGDSVEISQVPLADRILRIQGQDGIMVARPQDSMVTGPGR